MTATELDCFGSRLKVISSYSAGLDRIDINEVKKRGIKLGYIPNVQDDAVAEHGIGLMISAARSFHEGNLKIINDQWEFGNPKIRLGQEIKNSVVGIVGFGGIGQAIAKGLTGLNIAKLLYTGHKEKAEGLHLY